MSTITEKRIDQLRKLNHIVKYPNKFPPDLSGIYDDELVMLLGKASRSVGMINNYIRNVPNTDYLSYPLIFKEAILSSKIEGTLANEKDVIDLEMGEDIPFEIRDDALETKNHVDALIYGSEILKDNLLYSRTIKQIHSVLLRNVRGNMLRRGEFRLGSNAIQSNGEIVYLPPEHREVVGLMDRLDNYANTESNLDNLIKAAVIHHEFEAIHPFADGNGRMGRTLISLFMLKQGIIQNQLLFVSGYFFRHKNDYYELLQRVNEAQDWQSWIKFFLRAVEEQAGKSCILLDKISTQVDRFLKEAEGNIKSPYIYSIMLCAFKHIVVDTSIVRKEVNGITHKAAMDNLRRLESIGLLKLANVDSKRNVKFYNKPLLDILSE